MAPPSPATTSSSTHCTTSSTIPDSCDYLVVGAGATGMAFCDSLLHGLLAGSDSTACSIVLLDQHDAPGGQWNDSYRFVQLHQPSAMYGVASTPLEQPVSGNATTSSTTATATSSSQHRATRQEILDYYQTLVQEWSSAVERKVQFQFVGQATFDFSYSSRVGKTNSYKVRVAETVHTVQVKKRLVDARYLEPDLPISTAPTFDFDAAAIHCVPVNDLVVGTGSDNDNSKQHYVVIGAGKTGMDAVCYLLQTLRVPQNNILWIVPHDAWITAREDIGSCMEFLHDAALRSSQQPYQTLTSTALVQETFLQWEQQGKIYRLFNDDDDHHNNNNDQQTSQSKLPLPTKFKDATLSKDELELIRSLPSQQVIRGKGRVLKIESGSGNLLMQDGSTVELPWKHTSSTTAATTTYVHCSAGAFNYTKQIGLPPTPVFDSVNGVITLQDVYGTPGFCFVGSILGKLESLPEVDDAAKNSMCLVPTPPPPPQQQHGLGPSGGDVSGLSKDHAYVQRLCNLRKWLQSPHLREWLVGHRLFNLGHYATADDIEQLVEETWAVLKKAGLVPVDEE